MTRRGASRPARAVVTTTIPLSLDTFLREYLRQLSLDHEVHVVSSDGPGLHRVAHDLDVQAHVLPMTRDITPVADMRAFWHWVLLLLRLRPTLVLAATPKASLVALLAARLLRVPTRLYLMGGLRLEGAFGRQRALLSVLERLTLASATRSVANSPSLHAKVIELELCRPEALAFTSPGSSHGVDAEHYAPRERDLALRTSLGLGEGTVVVGFVGRLTHDKGVDALIEAAEVLQSRGRDAQWLVVGSQIEPDSARYAARLSSLSATVALVPGADDVRPYFALMDVNVLPSLREGFPNVVLEAAAMGLPTVTTDATGAVDSVIHGVTGLLVPTSDGRALADAIDTLAEDTQLRRSMGSAARDWAKRDFVPQEVVAGILAQLTGQSRRNRSRV